MDESSHHYHTAAGLKGKELVRAFLAIAAIILLEGVVEGHASEGYLRGVSASCPPNIDSAMTAGSTQLQDAAWYGHLAEAKHLVQDCGANVNIFGSSGNNAIQGAAHRGHADVVSFLIESGADPNTKNTNGWAPIHLALFSPNSVEVMRVLLDGGANRQLKTSPKDDTGKTAAQLAVDARFQGLPWEKETVEFLEKYVAKPSNKRPMECLDNAMKQVMTSGELQKIFERALLELLQCYITECHEAPRIIMSPQNHGGPSTARNRAEEDLK